MYQLECKKIACLSLCSSLNRRIFYWDVCTGVPTWYRQSGRSLHIQSLFVKVCARNFPSSIHSYMHSVALTSLAHKTHSLAVLGDGQRGQSTAKTQPQAASKLRWSGRPLLDLW